MCTGGPKHKDAVTERKDIHAADLQVTWSCTLLEFFYGSTKTIHFKKTVRQEDAAAGRAWSETVDVSKEIEIKPGMKPGTVLRFVGEGNHTEF